MKIYALDIILSIYSVVSGVLLALALWHSNREAFVFAAFGFLFVVGCAWVKETLL